jgi:hypothetical protein
VAVRDCTTADPVVTNIVIRLRPEPAPDLTAIVETQRDDLRSQYAVEVLSADTFSEGRMSEYNQLLQIAYRLGTTTIDLKQIRILLAMPSAQPETADITTEVVMTAPVSGFSQAGREFQHFVTTIAATPTSLPTGGAASISPTISTTSSSRASTDEKDREARTWSTVSPP